MTQVGQGLPQPRNSHLPWLLDWLKSHFGGDLDLFRWAKSDKINNSSQPALIQVDPDGLGLELYHLGPTLIDAYCQAATNLADRDRITTGKWSAFAKEVCALWSLCLVCLPFCVQHYLKRLWTDYNEIVWRSPRWYNEDLNKFWWRFGPSYKSKWAKYVQNWEIWESL